MEFVSAKQRLILALLTIKIRGISDLHRLMCLFYESNESWGYLQMAERTNEKTILTDDQIQRIRQAAESIRYGTVTLVIQDGRLIQIDRSEKIRLKSEN